MRGSPKLSDPEGTIKPKAKVSITKTEPGFSSFKPPLYHYFTYFLVFFESRCFKDLNSVSDSWFNR